MNPITDLAGLISFLVANDGITVHDAAKATHRTQQQLLEDLNRLMMCGLPPYSPSDYIQASVFGAGPRARVHVRFAAHFSRPLNFTPQEVVALKYALEHYGAGAHAQAKGELDLLARTLAEALHGRAREVISTAGRGFVTPRQTSRMRDLIALLSLAAEDQQLLEIEYYSSHRARLDTREVHPFAVLEIGPHFYLYAYCGMAQDTRHFRVDRIRDARLLDVFFDEKPPRKRNLGRMQALFQGAPMGKLVLQVQPPAAREVMDEWGDSPGVYVHELANGSVTIELPLYNQFWAIGFIISLGSSARVLAPRWLRTELLQTLKRSLKAHAG